MKKNNKGFTLAELLIVVAVIAVLVAVAIPTFANQLEKSRQGVDISNLRGAYAAAELAILDASGDTQKVYAVKTITDGRISETEPVDISSGAEFWYDPDTGSLIKVDSLATSGAEWYGTETNDTKGYIQATAGQKLVNDDSGVVSLCSNAANANKVAIKYQHPDSHDFNSPVDTIGDPNSTAGDYAIKVKITPEKDYFNIIIGFASVTE